jgi:WD40 repeat protein
VQVVPVFEHVLIYRAAETTELPDHGIRALKISSDGSLLATGDRKGNLRVHRINGWQELTYLEAHDSEILTIDFSTPASNGNLKKLS